MVKVLGLSLYGPLAASTRYRLSQYIPGLAELGIDLQVKGLLGDDYLKRRFVSKLPSVMAMLRDGLDRFLQLRTASEFDLIILYSELFPFLPASLERSLLPVPYIYDMDDAFYLRYRLGKKRIAQFALGSKFDHLMAGAAAVTAGNRVLSDYAGQFNAQVSLIPTVVDTNRYISIPVRKNKIFTIGWIGSPSTAETYLPELIEPLRRLGLEGDINFVVIGGRAPVIENINVIEVPWSEDTEVDLINTFDVGVMPLPDDEWARGKCAFKLIQYMACGVPVIASSVGANTDVVNAECGFFADSQEQWLSALRTLRDNPEIRNRFGRAGRQRVEQHYSLHTALPKLATQIRKAVGIGNPVAIKE